MHVQASRFLMSLVIYDSFRDEEWVDFAWNPVLKQMWESFDLTEADLYRLREDIKTEKEHLVARGRYIDNLYEGDEFVCGWDYHRYLSSVEEVFLRIHGIIQCSINSKYDTENATLWAL